MTKGMAARAWIGIGGTLGHPVARVAPGVDDRVLSPVGGGRQAPSFFSPGTSLQIWKKKLHIGPVALWEGDRGIFLKYLKTDIYFWNFFFKYKKEKTAGLPGLLPRAPIEVKAHTYSPTQYTGTLENIHLVSTRHRLYVLLGDDFDDLVDCSFSK